MVWDDGLILHTNLLLGGAWHLYRAGERWRKPSAQLRVGLTVDGFSAVCFGARTVETYREFDTHRHPGFGPAGPDLCAAIARSRRRRRRLVRIQRFRRPDRRSAARSAGGARRRQRVSQRGPVGLSAASVRSGVDAVARRHATSHQGRGRGVARSHPSGSRGGTRRARSDSRSTDATVNVARAAATRSRCAVSASRVGCSTGAPAARCIVAHGQQTSRPTIGPWIPIPRPRSSLPNCRGGAATRSLAERQLR